jgi:ecdysteroid kinase
VTGTKHGFEGRCYDAEYSSGRFHLLLEDLSETFLDEAAFARMGAGYRGRYEHFAETLGDRLGSGARAVYARVLAARDRLYTPKRLYAIYTLVHGDAHVWNILYPRDDAASSISLIDWDAWRIGCGAFDLAYMMALHWYPERRARLEAPLIERYHAGLLAHGVTDYSLERLWEDYRLGVIGHLATPVWQQSFGLPPAIWWPHLHRILAAFEDLDCAALLS